MSVFFVIKVNTNIYVGDFDFSCRGLVDVQLSINGKLVLNDTVRGFPPTIVMEKLRYGVHKINIYSKIANVNQEERIFLLPNQHIHVEFFEADTLFSETDTLFHKERIKSKDFIQKMFYPNSSSTEIDSIFLNIEAEILNRKSRFLVESRFNPFYYE
jgi:hypothetical protein